LSVGRPPRGISGKGGCRKKGEAGDAFDRERIPKGIVREGEDVFCDRKGCLGRKREGGSRSQRGEKKKKQNELRSESLEGTQDRTRVKDNKGVSKGELPTKMD